MAETLAAQGVSVLVVDDNEDAARSLGLMLSELGCLVSLAFDAPTALTLASQLRPDIVLVDIVMPRMDGIELAEALRATEGLANTRIIGVSGHDAEQWHTQMMHAGIDGFARKPMTLGTLEPILRELGAPTPRH